MLSLLGSLLGFGTSFLPKVMDYFQDKQDKAHELAMMDKQLEQQVQLGELALRRSHVEADIAETKAIMSHSSKLQGKAAQWVTNLAASVRPIISYLFFIEFFVLTVAVNKDWISLEQYQAIWNEPMQAIFASVVSFWFGSRTFSRMTKT